MWVRDYISLLHTQKLYAKNLNNCSTIIVAAIKENVLVSRSTVRIPNKFWRTVHFSFTAVYLRRAEELPPWPRGGSLQEPARWHVAACAPSRSPPWRTLGPRVAGRRACLGSCPPSPPSQIRKTRPCLGRGRL